MPRPHRRRRPRGGQGAGFTAGPGGTQRLDLRGPQRRFFAGVAGACAVLGAAPLFAVHPWTGRARPSDLWWPLGFAAVMLVIALYYLRVAYGWIVLDATGVRTSRLLRGRLLRWSEIEWIESRRYTGRAGGVTVVKVHTIRGGSRFLPAPRTTQYGDPEFERAVRYLVARVQSSAQRRSS